MNVLLIGANGYLGPHVVKALAPHHHLRITDIKPAPPETERKFAGHEFMSVDVTSFDQVADAAEDMDAIVNLSVVRHDPVLSFRVNTLGCYNIMRTAVKRGIRRIINTGPHFTVAGPSYKRFDHAISPDVPPHPGTGLYPLTKSLGQEICRAFTLSHDVYVQDYLVRPVTVRLIQIQISGTRFALTSHSSEGVPERPDFGSGPRKHRPGRRKEFQGVHCSTQRGRGCNETHRS